jgi:hypothetical protein
MSKPAAMLICPVVPLRQMPEAEKDVVRRFLFDHVKGMDRESEGRWRRMWGRFFAAEPGEGFQIAVTEERSGPFHRRHRAILETLFSSQERFRHIDKLHDWLKVGAGFVKWEAGKDNKPVAIPRSTGFAECSEDEIREAHKAMVDYLHEPRAQRFLWKHLKPNARQEMLDSILQSHDRDH